MVVVFLINKNCFFVSKYYRGAYSKLHRQSQEALDPARAGPVCLAET